MFTNWSLQQHLRADNDPLSVRRVQRQRTARRGAGGGPGSGTFEPGSVPTGPQAPLLGSPRALVSSQGAAPCGRFLCGCERAPRKSAINTVERPRERKGRTCVRKSEGLWGAGRSHSTERAELACHSRSGARHRCVFFPWPREGRRWPLLILHMFKSIGRCRVWPPTAGARSAFICAMLCG